VDGKRASTLSGLLVLVLLGVLTAPAREAGAAGGPGRAAGGPGPGSEAGAGRAAGGAGPGRPVLARPARGAAKVGRAARGAAKVGRAARGAAKVAQAAVDGPGPGGGTAATVTLPSGRVYVEHVTSRARSGARARSWAGGRRAPRSVRRPLVVALHGWRNGPAALAAASRLDAFADAHGFLLAYGVGVGRSWNAGPCCGLAAANGTDDVAYLADVVAAVAGRHLVDRRRVYVLGFSNGGMLAERAACERPDLFAAAGSVAGPLLVDCASPVPVRFAHLHGLDDTTVPYLGGHSAGAKQVLPSSAALPELVAGQVPGSTVELVPIAGMRHRWPTRRVGGLDGTATLWALLSRWSR